MSSAGLTLVGLPGPRGAQDLVRLEKLLHRRDQEFQALADHSDDLVSEFDRAFRYVYVNAAIERLTGQDATDLLGRRQDEVGMPAPLAALWRERLTLAFATREPVEFEFEWLFDGDQWPHIYQARLVPESSVEGITEVVLAIARDITARRNAEREARQAELYYRALIEDSLDLMAVIDRGGIIRYGSPSVHRLLGHTPIDLVGQPCMSLVHPEDLARVHEVIASCLKEPGLVHSLEVRLQQTGDRWRLFEIVAKGVVFETGTERIVLNGRDITDRRRLEAQLRQTQKIESIGRLAGGVAHDFNNLLAAILSNCELLAADPAAQPSIRNGLEEITAAGQRAAGLTHQLLAFSRRQVLQPSQLDLNTVIHEMEPQLRGLLGGAMELLVVPERGLESVAVDRSQMEVVLINLVTNARDAMPDGGQLTIATANAAITEMVAREYPGFRSGNYVVLSVRDTGIGMDAMTASHVFEPFFTTKEPSQGAGLGLATVYGVVKQSGGYIVADTSLSVGTEFRIYLPRVRDEASTEIEKRSLANSTAKAPAAVPQSVAVKGGETILLVEDEVSVRKVTVRLLQKLGYQVLVAEGPEQALALARDPSVRFDLVISDVVMPQMRGPAMMKAMLAIRPTLKVVFVSGFALDASMASSGLEPGMGFLAKPFSVTDLGRLVRQQLDGPAA